MGGGGGQRGLWGRVMDGTLALCCLSSDSGFAWTQWNHFGCIRLQPGGMEGPGGPTETLMKAQADKMVSSGMAKAGYLYINIVRTAHRAVCAA